jgi:serine/threonine protein kinase/tetratricopeptide (TPR) repeat protein
VNDQPRTEPFSSVESAPSVRLFAPGTPIGKRYEVREVLGTGGSAVVYAVFDRELSRSVALKVLRPDRMTEGMLKRFRREVSVAREADSPRLVKVYDIGTAGETVFLTMELVEGESLRERLHRGPLPVDEAVRIGLEVLEGLKTLHALGLVHRDVKPGNVLLAESGAVKLADFGLVRRWDTDESRATATDAVVGTFEYLSPEQALGRDLDGRSDLYSIGVLLFEMLTGDVPYRGLSSIGTAVAHLRERTPDPRSRRPEIPEWLSAVILRLLEKEPSDRYATAEDVLADLAAHRPPPRRRRLGRFRKWILPAAAALLIGTAILPVWPWNRPRLARLVIPPGQAASAYDAAGKLLWRRPDLTTSTHAAVGRFLPSGGPQVAAILDGKGTFDPDSIRTLSILDGATGAVLSTTTLPNPAERFPEFAPTFSAGLVSPVDLKGDGLDDVVVTYVHSPWWPSVTVLCSPRSSSAETVFVASGHLRFVFAADLDGDGKKEMILAGPSNRLGWNVGFAAVKLPVNVPGTVEASRIRPAETPDRDTSTASENLLWYALAPHMGENDVESSLRFNAEKRVLEFRSPSGLEILSADGFLRSDPSPLPPSEREAARRLAYGRLRETARLLEAGLAKDAVAEATQAVAAVERSGDRTLADWAGRVRARALVRAGRLSEAEKSFDSLAATSRQRAEVAFEAGSAFHFAGDLRRAITWYRRVVGRGGAFRIGRDKGETLDGIFFALGEEGRWTDALAEVDHFSAVYPVLLRIAPCYRAFASWKAGMPFVDPRLEFPIAADLVLAMGLQLRAAGGEKAESLLPDIEKTLAGITDGRFVLLSVRADLLAKSGRRAEALDSAREAVASARKALNSEVSARYYLGVSADSLGRLLISAGQKSEAARIQAERKELLRKVLPRPDS